MLTRSALVALFLCCSATPILAAESVGEATSLRPSATQATSGSAPQALAWKDQIYKNAQLATTDKGALEAHRAVDKPGQAQIAAAPTPPAHSVVASER